MRNQASLYLRQTLKEARDEMYKLGELMTETLHSTHPLFNSWKTVLFQLTQTRDKWIHPNEYTKLRTLFDIINNVFHEEIQKMARCKYAIPSWMLLRLNPRRSSRLESRGAVRLRQIRGQSL